MSQACDALQLVVFDGDALLDGGMSGRILPAFARQRGLLVGAVSGDAGLARRLVAAGISAEFDGWMAGDGDRWPFERLLRLVSVEPVRALFVSDDSGAQALATQSGLRTCAADLEELARTLP